MTERTRYDGTNTLVTIRDGDMIYFGISRCNLDEGDVFRKDFGRMIARNRAKKALKDISRAAALEELRDDGVLYTEGRWDLRGVCTVDNVKHLLEHFQDTDNRLYRESGDYRRMVRALRGTTQGYVGESSRLPDIARRTCGSRDGCASSCCAVGE